MKRFRMLAFVLLGSALAGACTDLVTTPEQSGIEAGTPSVLLGLSEEPIKVLLQSEKARIALVQEASKPLYDALKLDWESYLKSSGSQAGGSLVMCDPLQYAAKAMIVGPEGADIDFGPHKLSIPRGALAVPTVITAEAPTSENVVAKFSPHGLVFAREPTLTLSYKHCSGLPAGEKAAAYVQGGQITEWAVSSDKPDQGLVRARIGHFSLWGLAWP